MTFHLTAALASACLAFFRRALQMSRSSRRFSSSRLSFCRRQEGPNQKTGIWLQGTNLAAQLAQQGNEQRENILIEKQHKNSYTTYLYSLGWFKYKHNVLKHPGLIVVSSQSYWYSPPVSFQEVTQRSEESGGWGVEELTLSWSQSLLILSHCDQGTP